MDDDDFDDDAFDDDEPRCPKCDCFLHTEPHDFDCTYGDDHAEED